MEQQPIQPEQDFEAQMVAYEGYVGTVAQAREQCPFMRGLDADLQEEVLREGAQQYQQLDPNDAQRLYESTQERMAQREERRDDERSVRPEPFESDAKKTTKNEDSAPSPRVDAVHETDIQPAVTSAAREAGVDRTAEAMLQKATKADIAEVVAPEVQTGWQTQAAEQENASLHAATVAVETATDIRVEEEAWYFANETETHVRDLENGSSVAPVEAELNTISASDAEATAEIDSAQAESEMTFKQLTVGETDDTFDFAAVSAETLEEVVEPPADVHEQVDVLLEQFAITEGAEEYEVNDDGAIELDMTQEELTAELDAWFGEEGYIIVDSTEVAENTESTVTDVTVEGEVSLFGDYETEALDEEAVEEALTIQAIESYVQEVITDEPERFAELPGMERPEVLLEEMTQIAEAVQQLTDEEEMLGVDIAETKALYEQRLAVVVERLMCTLDPDFDVAYVPDIVDALLAKQSGREAAMDGRAEDATRERMSEPGYDIPVDDTKPWWIVGILAVRKEFAR